jgi:hypothetical protein
MFHPAGHPLERGWVGRIDSDRVVQLAAQTLQSFFLGGGGAREHAEFPLDGVAFLAPVLQPPTVRVFDGPRAFAFANANAIRSPGAEARAPTATVHVLLRPALVVGAEERPGGFTLLAELRAAGLEPPKDRDFALFLGPTLLTADEWTPPGLDWEAALAYAAASTHLRAGDVLAGPAVDRVAGLEPGARFELALEPLGVLQGSIAA